MFFEELGIKYPIIQGGMANIATAELASAVTNAGGLGIIGTGGWTPEQTETELVKMKELVGEQVYGVNIMLMNPHVEQIIDVCIEHDVKIITTGAGNPGRFVNKLHEHGIMVIPVVPSVALARRMEKLGCDAVIAEGMESGGHVGELTTMALVPQVVEAINIPVIAAGGIASNRQLVAALCLGAIGVQIGTILLATKECPIHDNYKQELIKAKDTSTIVTGRIKGAPVRALKNKMTREYQRLEQTDIEMMELEHLTIGSLSKAVFDGDIKHGSMMAGQVAGQIKDIKTVEQVLDELMDINLILGAIYANH